MIGKLCLLGINFLTVWLIMRILCIVLKLEPKFGKVVTTVLLLFMAFIPLSITLPITKLPKIVRFVMAFFIVAGKFLIFSIIFKRIDFRFLYVSILSCMAQSCYLTISMLFFKQENIIANILEYSMEMFIMLGIWLYVRRPDNSIIFAENVKKVPVRVYIGILLFLTLMSLFIKAATQPKMNYVVKFVAIPVIVLMVYIVMSVMKISVSDKEHEQIAELLENQLDSQAEYYRKINRIYSELRSFRHDFKNHLICLRSLLADEKTDEALDYMNGIEDMSYTEKRNYDTGNIIADALLNDKSEKAEKINAHLVFSGYIPTMGIASVDLCTLLSNAIDNAIDACEKDKTMRFKKIKINSDFKQGYFFFSVENPIFEQVHINKNNAIETTKENKNIHGFGLANIVKVAEKYHGETKLSATNDTFTLESQFLLDMDI